VSNEVLSSRWASAYLVDAVHKEVGDAGMGIYRWHYSHGKISEPHCGIQAQPLDRTTEGKIVSFEG
jgi:hypothetical protein